MKTSLEDVTFLIPIRLDSIIRIENLLATVNYIHDHFITNIFLLEASSFNNGILTKLLKGKVKYTFVEDKDPIFYRTKYLNQMTEKVKTPFVAIWDADVIVDQMQILDSVLQLRSQAYDIAYPYDGRFFDTSDILRILYIKQNRIDLLHRYSGRMPLIYGSKHKGGAFMANIEKYKLAGMENENFYGWGPEDYERYERWVNLNYKVYFSQGGLYHLTHPRDMNGRYNSNSQREQTNHELLRTKSSSHTELTKDISILK